MYENKRVRRHLLILRLIVRVRPMVRKIQKFFFDTTFLPSFRAEDRKVVIFKKWTSKKALYLRFKPKKTILISKSDHRTNFMFLSPPPKTICF